MPDKDPRLTPVPTTDLDNLTALVIRTDTNVRILKEELLPPLVSDTREARDKAREALKSVNDHVSDSDAHVHPCRETDRQLRQDNDIGKIKSDVVETKTTASGLSKLVWWLMGIAVTVALGAGAFAITVRETATANVTHIEGAIEDINEHEDEIDALREAQQRDRETYLKTMRELPTKVTNAARSIPPPEPTIESMEEAAEDLPLTPREQRQLMDLLGRARKRGNGEGDGNR